MSASLWPHGPQHTKLPCPSWSLGVCSNSCPLSRWCHSIISSSVASFSSYPQSFPASESFPVSWLFTSSGQRIGASALASVLPINIKDLFPLGLTGLISLLSKFPCSQEFIPASLFKSINSLALSLLYGPTLTSIHDYWKNHSFDYTHLFCKVISLLFNILSRFAIAFLPRSKNLLISWLQSPSAVILEPKKIKSVTVSTSSPSICYEVAGPDAMIVSLFLMLSFKPAFSPLSPSSRGSLVLLHILPLERCHLHIWGCWYFSQQPWFQLGIHPARHFAWCTLHHWLSGHEFEQTLGDNEGKPGVLQFMGSQRVRHNLATEQQLYMKLNKWDDNIWPWQTPFSILNQSILPCLVLTVASWPAHRFLRRQVKWSGIPISWRIFQFVVIHSQRL